MWIHNFSIWNFVDPQILEIGLVDPQVAFLVEFSTFSFSAIIGDRLQLGWEAPFVSVTLGLLLNILYWSLKTSCWHNVGIACHFQLRVQFPWYSALRQGQKPRACFGHTAQWISRTGVGWGMAWPDNAGQLVQICSQQRMISPWMNPLQIVLHIVVYSSSMLGCKLAFFAGIWT